MAFQGQLLEFFILSKFGIRYYIYVVLHYDVLIDTKYQTYYKVAVTILNWRMLNSARGASVPANNILLDLSLANING